MTSTTQKNSEAPAPLSEEAFSLLKEPFDIENELAASFLGALKSPHIESKIEDRATFAQLLHFAIDRGLVRQNKLAETIHYANSQVGRWAAGKAAPPVLVRRLVIAEMRNMIESLLEERKALKQANRLTMA